MQSLLAQTLLTETLWAAKAQRANPFPWDLESLPQAPGSCRYQHRFSSLLPYNLPCSVGIMALEFLSRKLGFWSENRYSLISYSLITDGKGHGGRGSSSVKKHSFQVLLVSCRITDTSTGWQSFPFTHARGGWRCFVVGIFTLTLLLLFKSFS